MGETLRYAHIAPMSFGRVTWRKEMPKRKFSENTSTTSFGSPGREGHDASSFYGTRLYGDQPQPESEAYVENQIADLDVIYNHSSEEMKELPDNSIHLVITSPPYNVGKDYDNNLTLEEYLTFLNRIWREVYRVLVPGGRACVNVANLGRKPYIPLNGLIAKELIGLGFLMRGEIIWDKSGSASVSTAWGSWQSASNPTLRDTHEYILVFSKGTFKREKIAGRESTITKEQFLEFTRSVWVLISESAKKVGHPAPFPVELPYRLIQLYSYANEVVLDPFMGSGQTALAALKAGRRFIGFESVKEYVTLANSRIEQAKTSGTDIAETHEKDH